MLPKYPISSWKAGAPLVASREGPWTLTLWGALPMGAWTDRDCGLAQAQAFGLSRDRSERGFVLDQRQDRSVQTGTCACVSLYVVHTRVNTCMCICGDLYGSICANCAHTCCVRMCGCLVHTWAYMHVSNGEEGILSHKFRPYEVSLGQRTKILCNPEISNYRKKLK